MVSLTVLREEKEAPRFARQGVDDSRTAIPTEIAVELAAALRQRIHGEVRFDAGSRALYATDGSNYRQAPIGVVIPRDKEDVVATIELARQFGAGRSGSRWVHQRCARRQPRSPDAAPLSWSGEHLTTYGG